MNVQLRNSLWNLVADEFHQHIMSWYNTLKILYVGYYKEPIDSLPGERSCRENFRQRFFQSQWFQVYNLIEFVLENMSTITDGKLQSKVFEQKLNTILERELSGFRSVNGQLIPITNESEIEAIRGAMSSSASLGFSGINQHFAESLRMLAKKPEPDYRNSIKESISAVEALCKLLTGEKSGGIDKALAKLSTSISLHQALKTGILNLYGYTSDEDGIRHPILEDSKAGFAEAKFMLVACSALVNFIIDKAREASML